MRIQPWMKAVSFAALLLAAQTPTSGQTPPMGGPAGYEMQYPDFQEYSENAAESLNGYPVGNSNGYDNGFSYTESPFTPGGYDNGGATGAQYAGAQYAGSQYAGSQYAGAGSADPSTLYPAGTPENFQPWPQVSPFYPSNVSQTQTFNRKGLWFKELLYHKRTYFGSIGVMAISYRNAGNALIGSPVAQTGNAGGAGLPVGTPAGNYAGNPPQVPNFTPNANGYYTVSNLVYPIPALSTTGDFGPPDGNLYPIYSASRLGAPSVAAGIQGKLGFFNEDFTGISLTAWGGRQSSSGFSRGTQYINGILVNQTLTDLFQGSIVTTQNGNVPLDNGEPLPSVPEFGTGSLAKYDLYYGLRFRTQAAGGNFSIYQQPLYRNKSIMIRSLVGMRYMYINEGFGFTGVDSGFNYDVPTQQTSGSSTSGSSGSSSGSSSSGSSSTSGATNRPTTVTRIYDQYTATLNNTVHTNLAGPEAGFRFDLGNPHKGFKVWGESIFGVAVNNSQIHLKGNHIGDPLADVQIRGYTTPRILQPGVDTNFNKKQNSTHVSPMFQQSIYADFDFLDVLPIVRNMSALDDATFRIGYTFFWAGSISRPADSIQWQGYPLYPQIQNDRQSWWSNQFTASLDFHF